MVHISRRKSFHENRDTEKKFTEFLRELEEAP